MRSRMTPLCLDCAAEYKALGNFRIGLCQCDMEPFADWLCHRCSDYFNHTLLYELRDRTDERKEKHLKPMQRVVSFRRGPDGSYRLDDEGNRVPVDDEDDREYSAEVAGRTTELGGLVEDELECYGFQGSRVLGTPSASDKGFSCLCGKVQPWTDNATGATLPWNENVLMVCLCCFQICESSQGINVDGPVETRHLYFAAYGPNGMPLDDDENDFEGPERQFHFVPEIRAARCHYSFENLSWPKDNPLITDLISVTNATLKAGPRRPLLAGDTMEEWDQRIRDRADVGVHHYRRIVRVPKDYGMAGNLYHHLRSTDAHQSPHGFFSMALNLRNAPPEELHELFTALLEPKVRAIHPHRARKSTAHIVRTHHTLSLCGFVYDLQGVRGPPDYVEWREDKDVRLSAAIVEVKDGWSMINATDPDYVPGTRSGRLWLERGIWPSSTSPSLSPSTSSSNSPMIITSPGLGLLLF